MNTLVNIKPKGNIYSVKEGYHFKWYQLRLLYECYPMAYIVESTGGKAMASPGRPILDIKPTQIHERTPIFIGSPDDVDEIMAEYEKI